MDALKLEIKSLIIQSLDLEDVTPDQIEDDAALFGDGLGLDSIDALELGVALRKKYGLQLEANDPNAKAHFRSVSALAEWIASQKKQGE